MAAERRPGSDRGRAAIDWHNAFLFYAALPAERRSYQAVADEFGVSRRTVERHGREDRWKQQARELDRDSARAAAERLKDQRADKLIDTEKLVEATYVSYANQLVAGQVKVNPSHLVKLFELRERIWERQDDETVEQLGQLAQPVDPIDPAEHKLHVLRALEEAGVLDRLLHPSLENQYRTVAGDERDDGTHGQGREVA